MRLSQRAQYSSMMFVQYFIWGAWFVSLGTYMSKGLHFDSIIGAAYSTQGVGAILAPLFIGAIADRLLSAEKVLGILHLMGAAILAWLSRQTTDPHAFFLGVLAYFCCFMPTLAVSNTVVFHGLENTERQFPAIRVFGTLGWIVAGLIVGLIPNAAETSLPMVVAACGSVVLGVYAFYLPNTPPKARGTRFKFLSLFGLDVLSDIKDTKFWGMIACLMLIMVPLSFYYAYANPFLVDIGAKVVFNGITFEPTAIQTIGQVSEVVFMLLLPLFFRLGLKWVLVIGMAGWAARYALFSFGFTDGNPIMPYILGGIALHGLCHDFIFVAGQVYVDQVFTNEQRARAQSFLALMTLGIGNLIGSNFAGYVYNAFATPAGGHAWRWIWAVPAGLATLILVVFAVSFRSSKRRRHAASA